MEFTGRGEEEKEESVRVCGAESTRPGGSFTDRVAIDLHVVIIRRTISGLMAPMKDSCMK